MDASSVKDNEEPVPFKQLELKRDSKTQRKAKLLIYEPTEAENLGINMRTTLAIIFLLVGIDYIAAKKHKGDLKIFSHKC